MKPSSCSYLDRRGKEYQARASDLFLLRPTIWVEKAIRMDRNSVKIRGPSLNVKGNWGNLIKTLIFTSIFNFQ